MQRISMHVTRTVAASLLLYAFCGAPAYAHGPGGHAKPAAHAPSIPTDTEVRVPDVRLLDRAGQERRLVSDVMRDRVVVVDFVYTTCTSVCPALSAIMASVQKGLADRLGSEVLLVSVAIDPVNDTPRAIDAKATEINAGTDWIWLTGSHAEIATTLRAFGLQTGAVESHSPVILVGRAGSTAWRRFVGFPRPADVTAVVQELL